MNSHVKAQSGLRGRVGYASASTLWRDVHDASIFAQAPYDVAIIGAGIVGCALAYYLSQYEMRVLVIEKRCDVGEGTSKANSAIIHCGFDAQPNSLESRLITAASRQWPLLAEQLKIPFERISALLVAVDNQQADKLAAIYQTSLANGVEDVKLLNADEICAREPFVTKDVVGGMWVPRESIIDPFTAPIAFAEVALRNGVDFAFNTTIAAIDHKDARCKVLIDICGTRLRAHCVVNVAGLGSRSLADLYDAAPFDINPRRGQFLLFDRNLRGNLSHILLPVPTKHTKGKLVTPTIFGNILAGPTAEDLAPDATTDTHTTPEGHAEVMDSAKLLMPLLENHRPIAAYAGARCNCLQGSYQIRFNDGHERFVTVTGIRSTGLTGAPALAQYLVEGLIERCGISAVRDRQAVMERSPDSWPGWWRKPWQEDQCLAAQPGYGRILCTCECVSQYEITKALSNEICPPTLDAVKRRTRATMGRCQGFNCGTTVRGIIADSSGSKLNMVGKMRPQSPPMSAKKATVQSPTRSG